MPRIRLTKSAIDALPTPKSDVVYWDAGCPVIAGWLLPLAGFVIVGGIIAAIINAVIGAVILLVVIGLFKKD